MQTGQEEAACALWTCLLMFSAALSLSDLLITPFLSPLPFLLCLRSSGVWQRDAALSERWHVPPPSAVPLFPRFHGRPVRESSLPGPRGVRWPIVWTGLLQSSPRRPPARFYPRSAPAIDCFPLLRDLDGLPTLNQNPKTTYVETELSTVRTWRTKDDVAKNTI